MFKNWFKSRQKLDHMRKKLHKMHHKVNRAELNLKTAKDTIHLQKVELDPIISKYGRTRNPNHDYYFYRKEERKVSLIKRVEWYVSEQKEQVAHTNDRLRGQISHLEKEKVDLLKEMEELSFKSALVKAIAKGEKKYEDTQSS